MSNFTANDEYENIADIISNVFNKTNTNTTKDLILNSFDTPIVWYMSLLLAVLAAATISYFVYKSNKQALLQRYKKTHVVDEINLADIEKDSNFAEKDTDTENFVLNDSTDTISF